MYAFNLHRPTDLSSAAAALSGAEDGKVLAGGMTMIPTLKQRLAAPSDLVDLGRIESLRGISVGTGAALVIGAMTTHATVASSAEVRRHIPALAALAGGIGDPQVRNRGTLGGSIANNDPAADYPAAVLALDASVHTNKRTIAADSFFAGMFETVLGTDEIIERIAFPIPQKACYMKFASPASRYALVGVFVAKTGGGVRVAVTGAGRDGVFRVPEMEQALAARFDASVLSGIEVPVEDLNADMHGSAAYRSHLITVMAARAVAACQ